jgi:hypothetical protein
MTASFVTFHDHADLLVHDDSGEFLLRWSEVLPTKSLLDIPEGRLGRTMPPFNPPLFAPPTYWPDAPRWDGHTEPPMERG